MVFIKWFFLATVMWFFVSSTCSVVFSRVWKRRMHHHGIFQTDGGDKRFEFIDAPDVELDEAGLDAVMCDTAGGRALKIVGSSLEVMRQASILFLMMSSVMAAVCYGATWVFGS